LFAHITIIAIARLVAITLIAAFFTYLYQGKRRPYLLAWTAGWWLLALNAMSVAWQPTLGSPWWLVTADQWFVATAGLALFCASRLYANARPWTGALVAAAAVYGAWTIAFHFGKVGLSPAFGIGFVLAGVAWNFWRESRKQDTYADLFMALVFLAWAPIPIAGSYYAPLGSMARQNFALLVSVPQLLTAGLMVLAIYEEEKRRVERNMVALANLNLTTSSFVGSEIERTLSQALDRVLSVVQLPAGAILLRHSDARGPTAAVSVGLDGSFCRTLEDHKLDERLTQLVARLGGLVVFRDIARGGDWQALDDGEWFLRFRQLAIASNLHTVVGISLQAKENPFGVLLLGTAGSRRFAPGELRLLLALGQQIGMAVENSYLIHETARQTEELHALNEIGRALNSTLDPDTLFEKMFTELRRMLGVNNFFIALYDSAQEQVRFELEVSDGIRLPKRSRPAGNHLTEHILRTGEPLLLNKNSKEEAHSPGLEPVLHTNSFCGVPLLVCERAIGVLAVHSLQPQMYGKDTVEMLRLLASQASVAIENARLFRAEKTKSRHLALLNNVSRNAITSLDSEEMLAKIAQQIEEGLNVDHVGIALLDYESKEVVIRSEGGRRRGAVGRRVALGEKLVGVVARSGQTYVARECAGAEAGPILEDSVSAIALPILYADQLLGVLYVETSEPSDFSEEEMLLMHTLADLISGALHNALTFQKAQEQAITDGLTGAKTHRFLMEALSAEWKRSTRAGRAFSLVVVDLDRFKFVNDFYGHLEGDLVLNRVGTILEQSCRRSDVVARYGGDEFVILMPETSIEQCRQIADKLRLNVCADPLLREKNVTASIGIASFPAHGSTPQELIQIADASMYLSKHQGGNAVSTTEHFDANENRKWKRDVLEAYLGVTLKRLFSTGPEAFSEIQARLEQFAQSLAATELLPAATNDNAPHGTRPETRGERGSEDALPPAVIDTLTSLSLAIDAKNHYTQGHSQKVAGFAALIAERLDLPEAEIAEIHLGGMLHDIGKVGVPESILNKGGALDAGEWELMKKHAIYGDELLAPLRAISRVRQMVRHHHEMYDGSGYPDGQAGDRIPLGARIIAIADAYDTITSERTYKKARSPGAALAEIQRCAGAQFDPQLVRMFTDSLEDQLNTRAEPDAVPERSVLTDRAR
jgi:diguanylate cyclase (GGDEF)-like protein